MRISAPTTKVPSASAVVMAAGAALCLAISLLAVPAAAAVKDQTCKLTYINTKQKQVTIALSVRSGVLYIRGSRAGALPNGGGCISKVFSGKLYKICTHTSKVKSYRKVQRQWKQKDTLKAKSMRQTCNLRG